VIISGTFEGLGRGLPSLAISLIRYVAFIPVAFVLRGFFGVEGIWSGFAVTEVLAAAASLFMLKRSRIL
jgi:Na+-driven multidrug efflux pump